MTKKPIYQATALIEGLGWLTSKPYEREHYSKKWAAGYIKSGVPVILAKYASWEDWLASSHESAHCITKRGKSESN